MGSQGTQEASQSSVLLSALKSSPKLLGWNHSTAQHPSHPSWKDAGPQPILCPGPQGCALPSPATTKTSGPCWSQKGERFHIRPSPQTMNHELHYGFY